MESDCEKPECKVESPSGSMDMNETAKVSAAEKIQFPQEEAVPIRPLNLGNRGESNLVKIMLRYIESLAVKGKDAEKMLNQERLENLVSKVEEEVEFEGLVEDMCMQIKAEGEYLDMERREREWEIERREVQLEEEVELLRSKAARLEEEIRIVHAEKEQALHKTKEEVTRSKHLQSLREQCLNLENEDAMVDKEEKVLAVVGNRGNDRFCNSDTMLAAFQDMLSEAEERANRERKALEQLEDTFYVEQQRWTERERHLESRVLTLENELSRTTDILKERESLISQERERRRQYGLEVDQTLAFWRDETSVHNQTYRHLKRLEDCLDKLVEKAAELQVLSDKEEWTSIQKKLLELADDLNSARCEQLDLCSPSKHQQLFENECIERWKAQRDLLEDERVKLEERLHSSTKKARDNERRIEGAWMERERGWMEKLSSMEAELEQQVTLWNRKEMSFAEERRLWELEIETCRKAWEEEREKLQVIVADREQWMEEQSSEWACLLDAKEEELSSLSSLHKKVADVLILQRQQLKDINKYLVRSRKGHAKMSRSKIQKGHSSMEDTFDICTGESEQDSSCLKELSVVKQKQDANTVDLDLERLVIDIESEIGGVNREVKREQERLEKERTEVRLGTEELKQERKELEKKVSEILSLMEDLKGEIKTKEGQMECERKQMEQILTVKTAEIEQLRGQLGTKEHEIEVNIQKFREEMVLIEKEVEKERKERQEVMDLHFGSRRKLKAELEEKEGIWEKEIEGMMQEVQDLKRDIDTRDQEIEKLKNEMELIGKSENRKAYRDEDVHGGMDSSLWTNRIAQQSQDLREEVGEDESNKKLSFMRIVGTARLSKPENQMCSDMNDLEWQTAIEKIAGFDRQIAEAMLAIQSLKEELSAKEKELQKARLERESDSEMGDVAWVQEHEQVKHLQGQQNHIVIQSSFEWSQHEQGLLKEREELLNLLEAERADTADAMSILQGAVRELHWELDQYKGKEDENSGSDFGREAASDASKLATKSDLVMVHASHLEEVDRFILDLKLKVEEAEKKARAAEIALAANEVKNTSRTGISGALVQVGKEWMKTPVHGKSGQDDLLTSFVGRDWPTLDSGVEDLHSPGMSWKPGRLIGRKCRIPSTQPALQPEQKWPKGSTEHGQFWNAGVNSTGIGYSLNSGASNWMTGTGNWMAAKGNVDSFTNTDSAQQGSLALVVSTPPSRGQRRWLVDASWLDHVRKEQSFLKHQLELERQRVSVLGQVEAENRWMEAAVIRALEQKRESDVKVLELEQKVAFLEAVITKKSNRDRAT